MNRLAMHHRLRASRLRTILSALAVVAGLAALPASASAAGTFGYVWAEQPTAASYAPSAAYQANSAGLTGLLAG